MFFSLHRKVEAYLTVCVGPRGREPPVGDIDVARSELPRRTIIYIHEISSVFLLKFLIFHATKHLRR